jgi:hypothetical protein
MMPASAIMPIMKMSAMSDQQNKTEKIIEVYQNVLQQKAALIDCNSLFIEAGRGSGKTSSLKDRVIRVAEDIPRETSYFIHKSYVALLSNIIPQLRAYYRSYIGDSDRPVLREGIDYVVGEKDLPDFFEKPRFPIENPKHTIVYRNGHVNKLVSSDRADSIAGSDGVHAFAEEMKHNKGEKVKTRIFPAMRGGTKEARNSPYYQGITGVSDVARVDLGEDDWFQDYEKNVDPELINEIASVAEHVNNAMYEIYVENRNIKKNERILNRWQPILREMRAVATYYLKASSFVNKEILDYKYFKTLMDTLTEDEFLAAVGNIRPQRVTDLFFAGLDKDLHFFEDGYKYKSIEQFNLKDTFTLTADYLKYFDPNKPLLLGYDPGNFSSIVVAQEDKPRNTLYVIKEFYCYTPKQQGDLAKEIYEFFGPYHKNKRIDLYYDRAGNKKRYEYDKITTDAKLMNNELKNYGFRVNMKSQYQRTIYYYEHFKLISLILSEQFRYMPRLRIDENECSNLRSALFLTAVKRQDGRIEMEKKSEKTVSYKYQASLTPQLPSALTYLLFGLYENLLPSDVRQTPDLPGNVSA